MSHDSSTQTSSPPASRPLVRNVMHLGLAQIASTLIGFALTASLGRFLGPADFGLYVTISLIWVFVYVVVDWGHSTLLVMETARGRDDESAFFGSALLMRALGTVLAVGLAALIARVMGFDARVAWLAPLSVLLQAPWGIANAYCYMFRARDRMDADAAVTVLVKGLTLIATCLVLWFGGGLNEVIWAQILGATGSLLLCFVYARSMGIRYAAPTMPLLGELLRKGLPLAALSFTVCLQPFIEIWLLTRWATPEVVGWYGAARNISGIFLAPALILMVASFPEMSRAAADLTMFRRLFEEAGKVMLIAAALTSAGLFVFADFGVSLVYGASRFDQAGQILRVMATFLPIWFIGFLYGAGVNAFGKASHLAGIKIVSVVLTALIAVLLMVRFQHVFGNGAIVITFAAGLAEVMMLIASYWLMPEGSTSHRMLWELIRAYAVAAVTVAILWPLRTGAIWLTAPLFGGVFFVVALGFRLIRPAHVVQAMAFVRSSTGFGAPRT